MDPLKEMFNRAFFKLLASEISRAYPPFKSQAFQTEMAKDLDHLELNARMRKTSVVLKSYLPKSFPHAIDILTALIPNLNYGYTNLLFPDFVGQHGQAHFATSMKALHFFTRYGSSEFAIREFLRRDFTTTIKQMVVWSEDENYHVRRLSSEGSRPRLPWSLQLPEMIKDPRHSRAILENLMTDESPYVQKSVANHLNDISKDHPEYLIDWVKKWQGKGETTDKILKHASRTLLKSGNKTLLKTFGTAPSSKISVQNFQLLASKIPAAGTLTFKFEVLNSGATNTKLRLEFALYFLKSNGQNTRKVFKISERTIALKAPSLFQNLFLQANHHTRILYR
ncbi:MAG: DNA alkylation repair protein [Saprospiraceae bacterium]|nr:DNA alkylation repair protein [Saprospiraceae bacterium]